MLRVQVRRLTAQLTAAAVRDVATEANKTQQAPEHANCCRVPAGRGDDKYNFGCRCRAERGRLLAVWEDSVAATVEHLRRLCRRQLMAWEIEEVRLGRRLSHKQKRAGERFVFAPDELEDALDAVWRAKMKMLADDMELERAALEEDASWASAEGVSEDEE
ncbi:hypothetical protein PspLS_05956 [Pyricularia sp. CBS 133598]|nr:hypothetical protein PspLS_05956 [Pyricularia sp. CBS 133598]